MTVRFERAGVGVCALVLLLAAACTSGGSSHPPTAQTPSVTASPIGGPKTMQVYGETIPWIDEAAKPYPAQTIGPNVPSCSADTLSTTLPGMEGATGGQMAGTLVLRNMSDTACTLRGGPVISLLDASGNPIAADESRGSTQFSPIKPKPPTWPDLLVGPQDEVRVFVESANQCGPKVAEWVLTLPDGSQERITHGWTMGICLYPHETAHLSVGSFEPPQTRAKWPLVPNVDGEPLQATSGSDLNYVVSLYNVPGRPFTFPSPCPSYEQRITESGRVVAKEWLTLNCATIGPIPGRTAVNFAMTMHVPSDLHGRCFLVWTLDPPYGYDTKALLTVHS
jgi:uncharacterized protein DUF4232